MSSGGEERKEFKELKKSEEVPEWMRDGLELKYVLDAISGFLKDIREPLRDLLNLLMEPLNGDRLGKDIGSLYKSLKENGVPEDLINEMVRKYFETKLSVFKIFERLQDVLSGKGPSEALERLTKIAKEAKEEEEENEEE
jgi:hypothetical protein